MSTIRITSNFNQTASKTNSAKINYGISYYCASLGDVKTINQENSWGMKILSKIDRLYNFVTASGESIHIGDDVIGHVVELAKFVERSQAENAQDLHIQINADNKVNRMFASMSAINNGAKYDILRGIDPEAGRIFAESKKMFLGVNLFKEGNLFYDELAKKFSKSESVAFVFLHEYSHAAELMNNKKYGIDRTETSYDHLRRNMSRFGTRGFPEVLTALLASDEYNTDTRFAMPTRELVNTLDSLYGEIYADVSAVLLMRNKKILEGDSTGNNITEIISHVIQLRKELKKSGVPSIYHDHFSSPGLESLFVHLANKVQSDTQKLLSEQDIHEITAQCVKEGIGKTLLTLIEADQMIIPQLNTLFSMEIKPELILDDKIMIDQSKNHYLSAMEKVREIVPEEWQKRFKDHIQSLDGIPYARHVNYKEYMVLCAGLDYEDFECQSKKHIQRMKEINDLFGNPTETIQDGVVKQPSILKTIPEKKFSSFGKGGINAITQRPVRGSPIPNIAVLGRTMHTANKVHTASNIITSRGPS